MSAAVLVTGGARRIGRAICERLAADGWRVLVHARREGDADARALARRLGGACVFGDLAESLGPARVFGMAVGEFPELSAVVNNAAVFSPCRELPEAERARMVALNATAPVKLSTLLALRLMTNDERGAGLPRAGAAVTLLDADLVRPNGAVGGETPERTPYLESKRLAWRGLAGVARGFGEWVRVNGVAPGAVLPPENARVPGGETLLPARPTPADVAAAVSFLLSAPGVTGSVLAVDAGRALVG